jgi:hypothetical protein
MPVSCFSTRADLVLSLSPPQPVRAELFLLESQSSAGVRSSAFPVSTVGFFFCTDYFPGRFRCTASPLPGSSSPALGFYRRFRLPDFHFAPRSARPDSVLRGPVRFVAVALRFVSRSCLDPYSVRQLSLPKAGLISAFGFFCRPVGRTDRLCRQLPGLSSSSRFRLLPVI